MYSRQTPMPNHRPWLGTGLRVVLGAVAIAGGLILYRVFVIVFLGSGLDPNIPSAYRVPPAIHPELAEHTHLFDKRVHKVGEHVYCAVGFGLANIIMVEGSDGIVIVDTGETVEQAEQVLAEIRKVTQKPVAAVVLTHHHADHVLGTSVFVSPEDAVSGRTPIIAHRSLVQSYADENGVIAELQAVRSGHMFGGMVPPSDRKGGNSGIGPYLGRGPSGFVAPNHTFTDRLETTIAGVHMELLYVPSEAQSEIAVYLPDSKTLLSAEVVQDHTFPNLYTIRGARYRDPVQWVASLDRLRELDVDDMVLQHGPAVLSKTEVARVLTLYRDQIQFVHDQTVRFMNKGLTPVELANAVELPPQLAQERPWGREFYGTVKHSVRNIYNGYVGWFAGDPVELDPTPPVEYARRMIAFMGGRAKVLSAANRAFASGDPQFAAELTTFLVRTDTRDEEARHLKAAAFRKLGNAQISANWRNYYLASAVELDAQLPAAGYLAFASQMLGSAMRGLPPGNQIAALPSRLKAEEILDQDLIVAVRYLDTHDEFRLQLRHGVLEVSRKPFKDASLLIEVTQRSMGAVLAGEPAGDEIDSGAIHVTGDANLARRFFGWFEKPFAHKPEVVVR